MLDGTTLGRVASKAFPMNDGRSKFVVVGLSHMLILSKNNFRHNGSSQPRGVQIRVVWHILGSLQSNQTNIYTL